MNKTSKIVVGGLASLALAGGVGAGIAAADPTPTPTASPTATAKPSASASPKAAHKKRPLLGRALHGEVTLAGKKHRVIDFQRGAVQEVSSTKITVKSTDGFTQTYTVDAKTKVRHAKAVAKIGDIHTNDKVRVVAVKDGSTLTAKVVADRTK